MNNYTTVAIAAEMIVDVPAAGHVTLVPIAGVANDPARPAGQGSKATPLHRGVRARSSYTVSALAAGQRAHGKGREMGKRDACAEEEVGR